jgi:hypothetical protein
MSDFLGNVAHGKVILFSDIHSDHNRTINLHTMFLHTENFEHTVDKPMPFEPWCSKTEVDSMHANTENHSRHTDIFDPAGCYTVVCMISTKHNLTEMDGMKFLTFPELQKEKIKNKKVDVNGETVDGLQIVWLQYSNDGPQHIFLKCK